MKENSNTELIKSNALKQKKLKEGYMLDLYLEMFLAEIMLKAEREKLLNKIDLAIDQRNRKNFMELSDQYKELTKRFGT
ncbi:IDEAL domain-containing protein [Niallia sp. XMNu-256]|uniref:IDEAL domain-containing protein n=1 Tax=Niallia sp. XMNu-256 TaxID=3082444 RepID=UPI0030D37074